MSDRASVAVLGAGIVNPVATTLDEFAAALMTAKPRLSKLVGMPIPRGKDAAGLVHETAFAGSEKAFLMASNAMRQAIAASGLDLSSLADVGVILATMAGESHAAERHFAELADAEASSDALCAAVASYPNGVLLQRLCTTFGLRGPRFVVSNACASGNIAVGLALDYLRTGKCSAVVVVGVEVVKPSMQWGAERAGFVGSKLAPFHLERDGAVLGEGAAAMVLADAGFAMDSGSLGWIEGFGCVCDRGAAPITLAEDGSGLYRAMQLALDDAARDREQLEYVNAHAPGTRMIDAIECDAISRLRADGKVILINSTKSITTHLAGAAAITEVIATLLQMRDGFVHGNASLDRHDPALAIQPVGEASVHHRVSVGLSNACGGGGLNTSIAVSSMQRVPVAPATVAMPVNAPLAITGAGMLQDPGFVWRDAHAAGDHPESRLTDFDVYRYYPIESNYHYMNRAAQLAAAAAALALAESGVAPHALPCRDDRFAVIFGTCLGGAPQASEVLCRGLLKNANAITPSMSLDHGIHLGAALVCRHYGLIGTTYTLTGSRRSGLQALEVAALSMQTRRADMVLVAGYDAHDAFESSIGSRLFDAAEPADAAGALVIETVERARDRGIPIRALLVDVCTLSEPVGAFEDERSLARRLTRLLAVHQPERIYLAAHGPQRHQPLMRQVLDERDGQRTCLTLGDSIPDPRAGLGMMAIADAIACSTKAAVVAPGSDGTVVVAIIDARPGRS
jgi:3-oxoacyl-[acyl-carrier-protein] synthase II